MAFALSILSQAYPQRDDSMQPSWLDGIAERVRVALVIGYRLNTFRLNVVVKAAVCREASLATMNTLARAQEVRRVSRDLRRNGFVDANAVAQALAIVRLVAKDTLGMTPHAVQLKGAYVLLQGQVAEMDTGEGKTLTASLAAACAAMAGLKVHVVTVNDYLAERDAATLTPFYRTLGFTVGVVTEGMSPEEKHLIYQADIVYGANKIIVFDYLRDRLLMGERMRPFAMALDKLSESNVKKITLPGLQFAIVDEADSVFIDEARTPLIISQESRDPEMEAYYRQAINLATTLQLGNDYELQEQGRLPRLTQSGRLRLLDMSAHLSGLWRGEKRREEAVMQALVALNGFKLDVDYIVRDGKVMIVDENTGRVMPDRSWERGLQQLMEIKEGLEPTPLKETLARISYQVFFRRYINLCGMTGTCREVSTELAKVYGLGVVRVPPHRPSKRKRLPAQIHASAKQRSRSVALDIKHRHNMGQPVLVGTRSILASEQLSEVLSAWNIPHAVLSAKQDVDEAKIIANAGQLGGVTLATNMAGRGTDIKLWPGVAEKGGLHVILTEGHDNRRVDRQLAGRCARQGDPGSCQDILSIEDDVMAHYPKWLLRSLARGIPGTVAVGPMRLLCLGFYRIAQRWISAKHLRVMAQLMKTEYQNRKILSFSGTPE